MIECQTLSRSQTRGPQVQWMWCWRCGGGSVCQRRLCRRTECQQDSPHTLLLCERQKTSGMGGLLLDCCARRRNRQQSSSDSRTDYSFQTCSQHCFLSFWFLCKSQRYELLLSTQPPSNSNRSDHSYTAADRSSQISLDGQDMVGTLLQLSRSCCHLTVLAFCMLCLGPVQVHKQLMEYTRHNTAEIIYFPNCYHIHVTGQICVYWLKRKNSNLRLVKLGAYLFF